MNVLCCVGARPNFVKIAALLREFKKHPKVKTVLLHTGQHSEKEMSQSFFGQLGIPAPDKTFSWSSGFSPQELEKISAPIAGFMKKSKPDVVVVVGDVDSTLVSAVAAKQAAVPLAHVEAGLRSRNYSMREEFNRLFVDHLADFLFAFDEESKKNLLGEGIPAKKIFVVGNTMIDTLMAHVKEAKESKIMEKLGLQKKEFALLTLHRAENVDQKETLAGLLDAITKIQGKIKIVFPMHPRTADAIKKHSLEGKLSAMKNLVKTKPLGYFDFLCLEMSARLVLTDSGGIQEETTVLGVPCITLRNETERPITVSKGTNVVAGTKKEGIVSAVNKIIGGKQKKAKKIPLWDGKASQRIAEILLKRV